MKIIKLCKASTAITKIVKL